MGLSILHPYILGRWSAQQTLRKSKVRLAPGAPKEDWGSGRKEGGGNPGSPPWEAGKAWGRSLSACLVLPAQFSQVSGFLEKELPSNWATSEMTAVLKSYGAPPNPESPVHVSQNQQWPSGGTKPQRRVAPSSEEGVGRGGGGGRGGGRMSQLPGPSAEPFPSPPSPSLASCLPALVIALLSGWEGFGL